jgi:hypothetical protein
MESWDWKQHLTLIISATSAIFITIRLLAISSYDVRTASAVLRSVGAGDILIGTAISTAALIASTLLLAMIYADAFLLKQFSGKNAVLIFLLVINLLATSWPMLIALAGNVFSARSDKRSHKDNLAALKKAKEEQASALIIDIREKKLRSTKARLRFILFSTFGYLFIVFLISNDPWLPVEEVKISKNGVDARYVGYVLESTPITFTILTEKHGSIEYLDPKTVSVSRKICSSRNVVGPSYLGRTLPFLLRHGLKDNYPSCPKD